MKIERIIYLNGGYSGETMRKLDKNMSKLIEHDIPDIGYKIDKNPIQTGRNRRLRTQEKQD